MPTASGSGVSGGRRPRRHQRPGRPQPQEPGHSAGARRHQGAGPAAMKARHLAGLAARSAEGFRSDLHGTARHDGTASA